MRLDRRTFRAAGRFRKVHHDGERGQVIPVVALFLVVLTGFIALTVDAGTGYTASRLDHDVADASALAAAYSVWAELSANPAATSLTAATTAAENVAAQNGCDADGDGEGTEETNTGSCVASDPVFLTSDNATTTTSAQTAKYVSVAITDSAGNHFAQLAGAANAITVSASAHAVIDSSLVGTGSRTTFGCLVCVLGNVSFNSKNTDITVTTGGVVINGNVTSCCSGTFIDADSPNTVDIQGTYTSGTPHICSNTSPYPPAVGTCTTLAPTKTGAFVDAGVTAPSTTGLTVHSAWSGAGTTPPGIYPSITAGGGGTTLTLTAGVYVITGSTGFVIPGGTVNATAGTVLYFACSSFPTPCTTTGQLGAGFNLTSTSSALNLTSPSTGPTANLAVYFDPHNTATFAVPTSNFGGDIQGAMYMPAGTLTIGSKGAAVMGVPLIVKNINITGTGSTLGQLAGSATVGASASKAGGLACLTTPPCRT